MRPAWEDLPPGELEDDQLVRDQLATRRLQAEHDIDRALMEQDLFDRASPFGLGVVTRPFVNTLVDPSRRESIGDAAAAAGRWAQTTPALIGDAGVSLGRRLMRGEPVIDPALIDGIGAAAATALSRETMEALPRRLGQGANSAGNAISEGYDWTSRQADPELFPDGDFIAGAGTLALEHGPGLVRTATIGPWENERAYQRDMSIARAMGEDESAAEFANRANIETGWAGLNLAAAPFDVPAAAQGLRAINPFGRSGAQAVAEAAVGAPRIYRDGFAETTIDPDGRIVHTYQGGYESGNGSGSEAVQSMRAALRALTDDIAENQRPEYYWTVGPDSAGDPRLAEFYREAMRLRAPPGYMFSEENGVMRLTRQEAPTSVAEREANDASARLDRQTMDDVIDAGRREDPLFSIDPEFSAAGGRRNAPLLAHASDPLADVFPRGRPRGDIDGSILAAPRSAAPESGPRRLGGDQRLQAAVRDPETGRVYTGANHWEAIESAPDGAARARMQAAYESNANGPGIGFAQGESFLSRDEATAAPARNVVGENVNIGAAEQTPTIQRLKTETAGDRRTFVEQMLRDGERDRLRIQRAVQARFGGGLSARAMINRTAADMGVTLDIPASGRRRSHDAEAVLAAGAEGGANYQSVAAATGVPLASVKKILNANDVYFGRMAANPRAARNDRILEIYHETAPNRRGGPGVGGAGRRLDNSAAEISRRMREEGYAEVTRSVVAGIIKRDADAAARRLATSSDAASPSPARIAPPLMPSAPRRLGDSAAASAPSDDWMLSHGAQEARRMLNAGADIAAIKAETGLSTAYIQRLKAADDPLASLAPLTLAAGGGALMAASEAEARESADEAALQEARSRLQQLEADERSLQLVIEGANDRPSVIVAQRILGVRQDGVWGEQTARAAAHRRDQIRADAQATRDQVLALELDSRVQSSQDGRVELARQAGPFAGFLAGAMIGHGTRGAAVRADAARRGRLNAQIDALLKPGPIPGGRSAAAHAERGRRAAALNEFWRLGGAGERVPYRAAQSDLGFRRRPRAAEPSELFPSPHGIRGYIHGGDVGVIGTGLGEAAFTLLVLLPERQKELEEAEAAVAQDPSSVNLARVESARNMVAAAETAWRAGAGLASGRAIGAVHPYSRARPNLAAAEAERSALDRILAAQTKTPRRR